MRPKTIMLIGIWIPFSWLAMQVVHEFGHILAARATGATVEKVVLLPWTLSRTEVSPPAFPQIYHLSGALTGMLLPVILWLFGRLAKLRETFLLRFFAGFCLVANGVYLVAGIFYPMTDSGGYLAAGGSGWIPVAIGIPAVVAGFFLWNGQSKHFGFGPEPKEVSARSVLIAGTALLVLIIAEILLLR
jgi:hypothetical protein